MRCSLACLLLALVALGSAQAAPHNHRLESIKQHALALHTISLAGKRRFADDAVVLMDLRASKVSPQQLKMWIDGRLWLELRFTAYEAQWLASGGTKYLGVAPMSAGAHQVRIQFDLALEGGQNEQLNGQADIELSDWPRGMTLRVKAAKNGTPRLAITQAARGTDFLPAAQHALNMGLAGQALTLLQTLAQMEPGATNSPSYTFLMGQCLRSWGLDTAAESMFAKISDGALAAEARLQAAELALDRKQLSAAHAYLDWPEERWPGKLLSPARTLKQRLLLAQESLPDGPVNIPSDAPLIWQYNLAVALMQAKRPRSAIMLLERIGNARLSSGTDTAIQDLANLKQAYWLLENGNPKRAMLVFSRISQDSPDFNSALLGRGWAALADLPGMTDQAKIKDDGMRPGFIQRIDSVVRALSAQGPAAQKSLRQALLNAISSWSHLRDADPMDPAVQEALVAIPYALAVLGEDQRAISYGDIAIARLESVRNGLSRIYTRGVKGESLNAAELAASIWPPRPEAWLSLTNNERWWLQNIEKAPLNAHMRQLLTDPQTLRILHVMNVLDEAEGLVRAAEESRDLALRAQQLRKRINAERGVQQKILERFLWTWLDRHGAQATRYLILARLIQGEVQTRQDN